MGYNVAVDGPAGAGKSTIAKLVAKEKGGNYNKSHVTGYRQEQCIEDWRSIF